MDPAILRDSATVREPETLRDPTALRVLHGPIEIAGQGSLSVKGLRRIGVQANLFAPEHPFAYDVPDILPPSDRMAFARTMLAAMRDHDIFHFYYGLGFRATLRLLDVKLLLALKKRVVVEFVGSDVRMPTLEAARNPNYVPIAGEDDAVAERRMRSWAPITKGHVVVCDHGLDPFIHPHFSYVHYVGQRVDVGRYELRPPRIDVSRPLVVHAPSDLAGKGTVHVRRAVEELRGEGVAFEYRELHGMPHAEVMAACAEADIVVDQLCLGCYGVFAVEAMSMAKPVICNMLPYYLAKLPEGCPVINADPGSIKDVLGRWLESPSERHATGLASRSYAERRHDIGVVARRLLDLYRSLPEGRLMRRRRSAAPPDGPVGAAS